MVTKQKKEKLVHIISSLEGGGAQAVLHTIIAQEGSTQYEHQVIYFHEGVYAARLVAAGARIYRVKGLLFPYDPLFFIRLLWHVRAFKPDCIHTLLWAANMCGRVLGLLLRVPVVNVIHSHADIEYSGAIRTFINKITARCNHKVIAVSPAVKSSLTPHFVAAHALPIAIIANGIDADEVVRGGLLMGHERSAVGLDAQHIVFGAVGRLVSVKNYALLIKGFAHIVSEYPHARLLIIGDGPEKNALLALINELELAESVFLCGEQPALAYYPLFDCFIQPSASEGLSIALLEAMSFGLSCVVTGHHARHDVIIDYESGLIVEPNNQIALINAMRCLAHDEALREALGVSASAAVRNNHSARVMVEHYIYCFDQEIKIQRGN